MKSETCYAGFWSRIIADFFDSLFLDMSAFLVVLMAFGALYWVNIPWFSPWAVSGAKGNLWDSLNSFSVQIGIALSRVILSLGYYTWATYRFGTTLGKKFLGIYVVGSSDLSPVSLKQSFVRCVSYLLSYLPFGAGFLMILFQPQKRGLHDLLAGTVSVRR